ncbi:hypothetical protein [Gracilibacillus sp. YIM 98692]|uniref:hypothetical protein n=1 Tax=Gracilibacillus sp. YIM 98692 TaxID=2663532 RepID=UPI0013D08A88|nr:hypothetical protein [Gracilibacillus sp. YIM 98692]
MKSKIIVITLIACTIIFSFLDQPTAVKAYTNQSKVVEFEESSSRSRSKTITLPFVDSIQNVTVDTGDVSYSLNGDQLKLYVSNGRWVSRDSYWDSKKYSKSASLVDSSWSTGWSQVLYSCVDGSWKEDSSYRTNDKGDRSYSDSDGYSGTLTYDDHWPSYTRDTRDWPCKDGETAEYYNQNDILFTGTAYKGGYYYYNYKYAYNVTISYVEHTLSGQVNHTDKWKQIHDSLNHSPDQFYSGEKFLLLSEVNDVYAIEDVTVEFVGEQLNDNVLEITTSLQEQYAGAPLYDGEIYNNSMSNAETYLKNGPVYFIFTAEWANGEVKQDVVEVEIIGNVYEPFFYHRTN